ncbi:MAG: 4-oxalocrotonate decarboxylase [Rhodospirillaceae bacterium BRH_c57]|nr:MAG: 4-oxalocrotonate decarboxylase [Rhodospirillaceae bacterium BRH_c57]
MMSLQTLADRVDTAAHTANAIAQLTDEVPGLTVEDAYAIQALSMKRRYARGEARIGVKMGLTSRAKMIQVGVDEVIWGRLTDGMRLEEGATLSRANYVHPRAEPEIAFLLKAPLAGEVTAAEAMAAVEAIAPAIEIIDSRYQDFKFTLPDVVADNSSSSGFILGTWFAPDTPIDNLGILLEADGRAVQVGSTAAILGHPVRSLVAAARMVARAGEALKPGDIILAGGATAAHPLSVGMHMRAVFQNLGSVGITVTE